MVDADGEDAGDGDDLWLFDVAFSVFPVALPDSAVALVSFSAPVFSLELVEGLADGEDFYSKKDSKKITTMYYNTEKTNFPFLHQV